ncbi:MAG: glycosyltransferase [Bacteroidia bacterium]|nr:glycosyltransferase [Bacteroidia bacterium]
MNKSYNIFICPLEWGLGHAARMIPVARKLREMNNNIFIGSGEEHLSLFRNELPGLSYIKFTGFKPGYSRFFPQYLVLLLKIPILLYHVILEHHRLKKIIREYAIDIVISDNRFGLWNRKVTSAYVTHMPLIPLPKPLRFLEFVGVLLHRAVIKKYSLCFIPDLPGELNVSGRLSHGISLPDNVRYTGILSRFNMTGSSPHEKLINFQHNTVILSGPEPQREILKQKLAGILKEQDFPTVMLEGRPDKMREIVRAGNIFYYNHLPASEMKEMITGSERIIARSGYTTIMELLSLNCSALLIPTPGQTEQEYLAAYLSEKGWFYTISQNEIKTGISFPPIKTVLSGEIIEQSSKLLTEALNELIEKHHKKD